jgi:hypothetical protein
LAKAAGIDTKVISDIRGHSFDQDHERHVHVDFAEVAREAAEVSAAIVPRSWAIGDGHGGLDGLRLVSDRPIGSGTRTRRNATDVP